MGERSPELATAVSISPEPHCTLRFQIDCRNHCWVSVWSKVASVGALEEMVKGRKAAMEEHGGGEGEEGSGQEMEERQVGG